jgi:hypothetical protein
MNDTPESASRGDYLTKLLGRAPDPTDHNGVRDFIHDMADNGLAVLLIKPGQKIPFDTRPGSRRDLDTPGGVYLATTDHALLGAHLDAYIKQFGKRCPVNIAVAVGASRLIVVDCDTREQVQAFLADAGLDPGAPLTVRSPGKRDHDGTWVHSDGGHYWYVVPDDLELPEGASFTEHEGRYKVMYGRNYVLVPPSVREEGSYTRAGRVGVADDWLLNQIKEKAPAQPRAADRSVVSETGTYIDEFSRSIGWDEILPPGWTPTGRVDNCGCPTWTAPGRHGNPKSATCHDPGCGETRYGFSDNPPMHFWTDNPGEPFESYSAATGRTTISKLDALAWRDFGGSRGDAMEAYGLIPDPLTLSVEQERSTNLPEEFWEFDPVLMHIRQAAHRSVNSADAVIGAVLAILAAHVDPAVTVDTGVKLPMPLNMFVGLVGSAGTGKSSAYSFARRLLKFEFDPFDGEIAGGEVPRELPVGTGPGLADAYMDWVMDLDAKPKPTKRREQVRHKLLLTSDEGAGLVAQILDNKSNDRMGPTLRLSWTGALLGQANASTETKREVRDYALGLCVGFQLEALAALSTAEQMEVGTPQRFVYFSATDPSIPDDPVSDPGTLTVTLPKKKLRYCDELQTQSRRELLERSRGMASGGHDSDPMQAHRPAMTARLAALLVIMCAPDRDVIYPADVKLAEMVLDASSVIHQTALDWRQERETAKWEREANARITEKVAEAVAVGNKDTTMALLKDRIVKYVTEVTKAGGTAKWKGENGLRTKKFKGGERTLADQAKDELVAEGKQLVSDDGDILTLK